MSCNVKCWECSSKQTDQVLALIKLFFHNRLEIEVLFSKAVRGKNDKPIQTQPRTGHAVSLPQWWLLLIMIFINSSNNNYDDDDSVGTSAEFQLPWEQYLKWFEHGLWTLALLFPNWDAFGWFTGFLKVLVSLSVKCELNTAFTS